MVPHPVQTVPGSGSEFLGIEGVADAGVAEVTDGVAEGPLGYRCGKPGGIADDPVGHIAAVAAAQHAQTVLVDLRAAFQYIPARPHTCRRGHGY